MSKWKITIEVEGEEPSNLDDEVCAITQAMGKTQLMLTSQFDNVEITSIEKED